MFVISSSRFRRQVKLVLLKKCWYRWESWCSLNQNQVIPENRNSYVGETEHEGDC